MGRTWGYLAGGGALLLAGIVGTQTGLFSPSPERPPATLATPTSTLPATVSHDAPPAPEAATRLAAAEAEVGRLTQALAAAEAENAELRATLALRDTVLATLQASVAERDAALADVRARMAANETELASLRGRLGALRGPASFEAADGADFDSALAAMKGAPSPSAARLEPAAASLEHAFGAAGIVAGAPVNGGAWDGGPMVEVQFDFASAALTPGGEERAALAAAALSGMELAEIRVVGHTDRVGRPEANRRLAARRAAAVARFLVTAGLPRDLIVVDGAGEAGAPVATDDGVAEPLNRSVLIFAAARPTS